jgi:hypothetical protein
MKSACFQPAHKRLNRTQKIRSVAASRGRDRRPSQHHQLLPQSEVFEERSLRERSRPAANVTRCDSMRNYPILASE